MSEPKLQIRRPKALPGIPLNYLLPNALTMLALCSGMTAIRFAMQERWEHAVFALLAAAVFDVLDGRIARLLKSTSQFGAELDSLSDVVSFGVAPALILYLWALHDAGPLGWICVLVLACCCALRLARFNTGLTDPNPPPYAGHFFTGTPAPAGAGLAVFPLIISLELSELGYGSLENAHWAIIPWVFLVGGLMVSRLPTFAFKKVRVPQALAGLVLLAVGLLAAFLINTPWLAMSLLLLTYLVSLPISYQVHRAMAAKHAAAAALVK